MVVSVTELGMIDISEADLDKLLATDQSVLADALNRVLATSGDVAYNSFQATI